MKLRLATLSSKAGLFQLFLALFFVAVTAVAQTTTGSIYGTVSDSTGAVIPNAKVTVTNVATGEAHDAAADSSGNYTFVSLVPGDYKVAGTNSGFQTQTQQGVRLDANQNVHINFTLLPGEASQNVTVDAATTLVDTRESQIGQTVDTQRMQDLPLNGRNAYDLVQIIPGVTSYTPDVATGSRAGTQLSVNGLPTSNTAFYLDGAYDTNLWQFGGNLLPNPDALQEFRILTSNFDAEFGRAPGGVVNVITRSGTSQYHGLAFEYIRNNVLNAKNWFLTSVTPLRQNQFGADFGGPVPFIRDKAFFFLSYQGLRLRTPANIASSALTTPTALERSGDFRSTPASVRPKGLSCNGVADTICANQLDPVAQNVLKYVPVGDTSASNYGHPTQQSANANLDSDQGMARIDYHLSPKHQLSGLFFISRGTSNNPAAGANQILSFAGMQNYEGQYNGVASDTWLISANKVNNLRAFYSLNHYIIANIYGQQHMLAELGSQAAEGGNYNAQPYFSVTGYWTMGTSNAGPNNLPSSTLGASDTFNWSIKRHEIKAGGSYMWDRFSSTGGASSNGLFTFTGSTSGNALVDFLEGKANSLTQNNGVFFRSHSQDPSLFVQDNWKLSQRLTLNLGLRWEYYPMYTGQNNTGTFVAGKQSTRFPNAPLGLLTSGDAGVPDGILQTPKNNFAPRVGFAYDVFGKGKTSLRGAYGIFYAAVDQVALSNNLVQQPFSRTITVSKTPNLVNPYSPAADPFPYTPDPAHAVFSSGATIFGLSPNDHYIPSVQEYNLTVQQQYGSKWSSEISYIGNTSRHFYITLDANSPIYSASCTSATCGTTAGLNNRRPYQPTPLTYTFGTISVASPISNASYNSLQATVTRRFDHHFSLLASYVWSKSLGYGAAVNAYDINSAHGLLSVHVPQAFVASYVWESPQIDRWGFVGKQVLSGWQLNGITTLRKGSPFNVTSGTDTNFDGTNNDRPNQVSDPHLSSGRSRADRAAQFFKPTAFAATAAGQPYGNTAFDSLIAPGYINTDFSAFKSVKLYDSHQLQFRAEAFNVFNNVNMNAPNSTLSSPQFGKIAGANSPRILQFGLRYSF